MASSREEQLRNNRRLTRQIIGAVALVFIVVGIITVLGWCVTGLRTVLDDSERKESYADRVYGLVMFDVVPFDDVSQVDSSVFRQAAIWGTVYTIQKNDGSLDAYERDTDTGSVILPRLEVDTYLTNLLGPDYQVTDGSFETAEFVYTYDEEKQGYLVPVTGSVGLYTPEVEKISTQGGKTYVTVGYIPTINNSSSGELSLTAPTEPTKYMDFVFSRGENRQWYLTALQESDMQPETTATPSPTAAAGENDPQALVENNLDSTMTDAVGSAPPDAAAVSEPAEEEASSEAESVAEEPAAESEETSQPDDQTSSQEDGGEESSDTE